METTPNYMHNDKRKYNEYAPIYYKDNNHETNPYHKSQMNTRSQEQRSSPETSIPTKQTLPVSIKKAMQHK